MTMNRLFGYIDAASMAMVGAEGAQDTSSSMVDGEMSEIEWSVVLVDPLAEIVDEYFLIPDNVKIVPDSNEAYWKEGLSED